MQKLQGIQKYYHRLRQSENGSDYYIEPRTSCPISVLNKSDKFVILMFDKDDDYIVINNHRYYLTKRVAVKATDKINRRIAVVDIDELEQSKPYTFKEKFTRQNTLKVESFDDLRALAKDQYSANGSPFVKQLLRDNHYYYEPSFSRQAVSA